MANTPKKNGALYKQLKQVIESKKDLREPLIEILREAQEIFGYLPREVQEFVAEEMQIPVGRIYGVVTFYNFFSMEPRGKHISMYAQEQRAT